jgi:glycosyltransferase involved in cell wall biosynthesis
VRISAVIIAGNEELKIADAIRSVDWADEILVIDSQSTDATRAIAESLGARAISRPWPGFSAQKQFGCDSAANDWIFSLDADERVSAELTAEIALVRSRGCDLAGFRIPRLAHYMSRPIRHSGWYPDRQLRLFDRRRAKWSGSLIHESVEIAAGGAVGKLDGEIIHLTVDDAAEHHRLIGERYAPLAARQMFERGRTTSRLRVASAGFIAFFSSYVLKAGFLDGFPGFCIARFSAHHAFLKHLLLWEMQNSR